MSGSCSASRVSAVCRVARSAGSHASTTVSSVGGENSWTSGRASGSIADEVADPGPLEPDDPRDAPGRHPRDPLHPAASVHRQRR